MKRVTVEDVPSWSYRGLEAFLYIPAMIAALLGLGTALAFVFGFGGGSTAGAAGGAGATGVGTPGGEVAALIGGIAAVWLLGLLLGLASAVAIPLFLYFDAGKIASQNLDWEPNRGLYAVGGFFLSGLVVWHYLYRRHQHVVDWVGSQAWWYLALIGVAIGALAAVGSAIGPGLLFLGFVGLPLFAIGVYKDATYARLNSDWRPNPVNHFLAAFFTGLFAFPAVFYFGYYVYKRHAHLGLL
ncbi:hypothetical protein HZS55_10515 [Halosimplex rubrum]|uniref:Uncharacterized protein n=1 Tax=Halosimplex rubrum TaxID=869889 RepID=A0A7D5SQI6_9EURY|nr:hypothetical protein [Halosimplex rubrum]QLH77707.1 hypothetical protein HZS55_10515 [Halosimplex rubrum]